MVLAWFDPLSQGWQAAFYVAAVISFALGVLAPGALSARVGGLSFVVLRTGWFRCVVARIRHWRRNSTPSCLGYYGAPRDD